MEKTVAIVNEITDYVNVLSRDNNQFNQLMSVEHRTLQQAFTRLCLKWLEHVASDEYKYDLRNEDSKKVATELVEGFVKEKKFKPSEYLRTI